MRTDMENFRFSKSASLTAETPCFLQLDLETDTTDTLILRLGFAELTKSWEYSQMSTTLK